jgi:GT2 family glycosyltransferase
MRESVMPVTVAVPTIGRPQLLRQCLASIAACDPRAAEILVVDQSGLSEVAAAVQTAGAQLVRCEGRGASRALNAALRAAAYDVVLVTNDDCTVASDWVAVAWEHMEPNADAIVTGQVRAGGDGEQGLVPSTNLDPLPHDYSGQVVYWALYGGNMALPRDAILALGGFDERRGLELAAEDCDLCYRWTKAGRPLRYEPDLVVWHHDWRTPGELHARYVQYGRGQGAFYAKHIRAGDRRALRFLLRDLQWGLRGLAAGIIRRRPAWTDERRGLLRGLPSGLWHGWVEDRRLTGRAPQES